MTKGRFVCQTLRTVNRRSAGEEFEYNKEGSDCNGGELLRKQKIFPECFWEDFKVNIIGKRDDSPAHFCDKFDFPIKICGHMIPCKHAFCYDCANLCKNKQTKQNPPENGDVFRL